MGKNHSAATNAADERKINFTTEEYSSLRSECITRISIMNNQASSALGVILTCWGAGFGLIGIQVANMDKLASAPQFSAALAVGQIAAFFFAILLLIPMSVKSGENIIQLISLGTYIRVFYEYLSFSGKNWKDDSVYMWEIADKRINTVISPKTMRYYSYINLEYALLGSLSVVYIIGICWVNFSRFSIYCKMPILWIIVVALILSACYFVGVIMHYSTSTKARKKLCKKYTQKYLTFAVERGYIAKNDLKAAWDYINPINEIDETKYSSYFSEKK